MKFGFRMQNRFGLSWMPQGMGRYKTSPFSGITRSKWVKGVTLDGLSDWESGELIQDAAPNLTTSEREFIINGVTDEEWSAAFGEEDED